MERDEIIAAARELITSGRSFVLATVGEDGFPQMRWMGAAYLEELITVYMAAGAESRKMGQIRSEPKSQLMFQSDDYSRVGTLTGSSEVVEDAGTKQKVFAGIAAASQYFSGPDDPNFGVIKFTCRRVEMLGLTEGMGTVSTEV